MYVVATAGHVDHGKSTLVRELTGIEPDRWREERRRGLTIDLGFAWTKLPSGADVAFVDVPGHERFVANMLAGVGPVPAAMMVVAADEGWMPQSAEHLAALDALGVRHGLLVVTRSDLTDPETALLLAREEMASSSLADVEAVCVSGVTGEGMERLRDALDRLVDSLPAPDLDAPVRLWVDRAFTIAGSGTVVTGTLAAGTLRVGDTLQLGPHGQRVRVRGLEALKRRTDTVAAVARVAVNLRGVPRATVHRGHALVTPERWLAVDEVDVRLVRADAEDMAQRVTLHIGAAAVPARVRPLGKDTARLRLRTALPLRIGDRVLLRDPGSRRIGGAIALDVRPPSLRGRGRAAERAQQLDGMDGRPDGADEVRRRGVMATAELRAMGAEPPFAPLAGDWLVDPEHAGELRQRLRGLVAEYAASRPLEPGMPVETVRQALGLVDPRLVEALASDEKNLVVREGRVGLATATPTLPAHVEAALVRLRGDLDAEPFSAPDANRLAELRLGPRELAAAVRLGRLVRLADGVFLLPGVEDRATEVLAGLDQPFTMSEARRALGTTRRVAVPLLEHLDRLRVTRRLPDDRRQLVAGRPGR